MKMTETLLGLMVDGNGGWKERSVREVLGKEPRLVTVEDVIRLSWKKTLQLFHAAPAPTMKDLEGEYRAMILPAGVFAPLASFFTHRLFGPGRWQGKAFKTNGQGCSEGYNLFSSSATVTEQLSRTRRFRTLIGPSRFDGRLSFCLDYSPYNRFLVRSMWDEIRQLSSDLFLGLGTMASGGGALNPAPFALFGKPQPWRSPQQDWKEQAEHLFEFNETQLAIQAAIRQFCEREITPLVPKLETGELSAFPILRKMSETFALRDMISEPLRSRAQRLRQGGSGEEGSTRSDPGNPVSDPALAAIFAKEIARVSPGVCLCLAANIGSDLLKQRGFHIDLGGGYRHEERRLQIVGIDSGLDLTNELRGIASTRDRRPPQLMTD